MRLRSEPRTAFTQRPFIFLAGSGSGFPKERGRPRPQPYARGNALKVGMAFGTIRPRGCPVSLCVKFRLLRTRPSALRSGLLLHGAAGLAQPLLGLRYKNTLS